MAPDRRKRHFTGEELQVKFSEAVHRTVGIFQATDLAQLRPQRAFDIESNFETVALARLHLMSCAERNDTPRHGF
jgi:hypothetical protein